MRTEEDSAPADSSGNLDVRAHSAVTTMMSPVVPPDSNQSAYEQGLLRLVDDVDRLAAAWEREPIVSFGLGSLADVVSVPSIERLLCSGLPLWAIQLFDRGVELPLTKMARPTVVNTRGRQPVVDAAKAFEAVCRGATLTLHELQTFSPEVNDFASLVAAQTGYDVSCWAFLTPPHSNGVKAHEDKSSAFLRQIAGSKRWRVSRPVHRRPGHSWRPGQEVVEVLDVVLREGDCLYIPRGFVHVGETEDEPSVHLTLSVDTQTWAIALQRALTSAAAESDLLGQMTPPWFDRQTDRAALFEQSREQLRRNLDELRYPDIAGTLSGGDLPVRTEPDALGEALLGRLAKKSD